MSSTKKSIELVKSILDKCNLPYTSNNVSDVAVITVDLDKLEVIGTFSDAVKVFPRNTSI